MIAASHLHVEDINAGNCPPYHDISGENLRPTNQSQSPVPIHVVIARFNLLGPTILFT